MAGQSRKRRAEELSDDETWSLDSNATIPISSPRTPKQKAVSQKSPAGLKKLDRPFTASKLTKSLPKREHPQRKRRKTEKALEPTDDELSDVSFTLLTDNEKDDEAASQKGDGDSSSEDSILGRIVESSDDCGRASPETDPTIFSSPAQVDTISHLSSSVGAHIGEADVCVAVENYSLPLYIYKCLKRSDPIVFSLCQWEARKGICAMVSDEDEHDMHVIPIDATYLIFGDYMIGELGGSVIFFASKVNEHQPYEKYMLKVGFYYEYRDCLKAWVDEVCSPNCCMPLVELDEIVSQRDGLKFQALYADMEWAINLEFWSRNQRPPLKRFVPHIHTAGTRRRSRVITNLDLVFDDDDDDDEGFGSETDSNATVLAPADWHMVGMKSVMIGD